MQRLLHLFHVGVVFTLFTLHTERVIKLAAGVRSWQRARVRSRKGRPGAACTWDSRRVFATQEVGRLLRKLRGHHTRNLGLARGAPVTLIKLPVQTCELSLRLAQDPTGAESIVNLAATLPMAKLLQMEGAYVVQPVCLLEQWQHQPELEIRRRRIAGAKTLLTVTTNRG
eukprot:scaffold4099_cov403-Prasinococcus_capsulatus_cf.AAC.3